MRTGRRCDCLSVFPLGHISMQSPCVSVRRKRLGLNNAPSAQAGQVSPYHLVGYPCLPVHAQQFYVPHGAHLPALSADTRPCGMRAWGKGGR